MNHKTFEQQLSAYSDRELPEEQMDAMRVHLEGCSKCRARLQVLASLRTRIREAADIVPPDNFVISVRSAIRREQSESIAWLGTERFARNIVLGLTVLVLALVAFESYLAPQQTIGVDRYFNGEPGDSTAQTIISGQQELSKADVLMAALTK